MNGLEIDWNTLSHTMTVIGCILGYFMIGVVWSGIVTRTLRGDSSFLPLTLMLWPVVMPVGLLIKLYATIIGKKVSEVM